MWERERGGREGGGGMRERKSGREKRGRELRGRRVEEEGERKDWRGKRKKRKNTERERAAAEREDRRLRFRGGGRVVQDRAEQGRAGRASRGWAGQGRVGQGTGYEGGRGAAPRTGSQSARVASAARSPVLRGGFARRLHLTPLPACRPPHPPSPSSLLSATRRLQRALRGHVLSLASALEHDSALTSMWFATLAGR